MLRYALSLILVFATGSACGPIPLTEENNDSNALSSAPVTYEREEHTVRGTPRAPSAKNEIIVAPDGSARAKGTSESPLSLSAALRKIRPGETISLLPGSYRYKIRLDRQNQAGITLRSRDKSQPAVIDGRVTRLPRNGTILEIRVDGVTIRDLVITDSSTDPGALVMTYDDTQGQNPNQRGPALHDRGNGTKIINCVIHDTGGGIHAWSNGSNQVYYGNIIYNNGTDAPSRLNGQGIYTQNRVDKKVFEQNVVFNNFDSNLQMYGSSAAAARGFVWRENVIFNGRALFWGPNIEDLIFTGNHLYRARPSFGAGPGNSTYLNASITENFFMSGVSLVDFVADITFMRNTVWNRNSMGKLISIQTSDRNKSKGFRIDNNTYYRVKGIAYPKLQFSVRSYAFRDDPATDYAFDSDQKPASEYISRRWVENLGFDLKGKYIDHEPKGVRTFVKRNKYDPDRFLLVVYNFDGSRTVEVDLGEFVRTGEKLRIRNVQDYFSDVITARYPAGGVKIDMNRPRAKPNGYEGAVWKHDPLKESTFPEFGVFIIERRK